MKRAFYDSKPASLEAVGNGSYLYRWDIIEEQVTAKSEAGEEVATSSQWSCNEVVVWNTPTSNSIFEAVMQHQYGSNYEAKLVNEYNAAQLGVYGAKTSVEAKAKIDAYKAFLAQRQALKAQVDADCAELNIV